MLYIDYRKTFGRAPNLKALWERMLKFSTEEHCNVVLISAKPFLINHYGTVSEESVGDLGLVHPLQAQEEEALWPELILVERLVREGTLSEEQIIAIDARSIGLLKIIDKVSEIYDSEISSELLKRKLLN